MKGVVLYACGPRRRCPTCGRSAIQRCAFAFKGRRAGERCDKLLCERCRHGSEKEPLCEAHFRLEQAQPKPEPEVESAPAGKELVFEGGRLVWRSA